MKLFSFFLLLALLPALALAAGGPNMGPEIEFRGKRQIPSMLCQGGDKAAVLFAGAGLAGTAVAVGKDSLEGKDSGLFPYVPIGTGGGLAVGTVAACIALHVRDRATSGAYLRRIYQELEPREKKGELRLRWEDGLVVEHANGRKIIFSTDMNVVEVKLPPITPDDLTAQVDFYQKELYEPAERAGLRIPRLDGPWNGGHVHIDIATAFDSDPRKLKNFLLDFIEHPELADGVLVKDSINAPPIRSVARRDEIETAAEQLDRWAKEGRQLSIFELAELNSLTPTIFGKKSALNINARYGTLEVRGLRSQKNARELAKVMRLLAARIHYTNSLPDKKFHPRPIKLSSEKKSAAFRRYVEEAGLDYGEYRDLAAKKFRLGCAGDFARLAP